MLAYGCECWDLTEKAEKSVRAWNARRMAMITGREIKEEYHSPSFDLLGNVRARRLKWAGQLLRAEDSFLPRRVALTELEQTGGQGSSGGIFQDAPKGMSVESLIAIAQEKKVWATLVGELLGHEEKQASKGKKNNNKKNSQGKSDVFMVANGYVLHKGAWIHSQEFEMQNKTTSGLTASSK